MKTLLCFPWILAVARRYRLYQQGGSHNSGDYIGPVYPASGMYYGSQDYYYHDDYPDYIVTPRPPVDVPDGPDNRPGLRPEHPIANPPGSRPGIAGTGRPRCRQTALRPCRSSGLAQPSIPSRSRPMGGGRRGGGGRRR